MDKTSPEQIDIGFLEEAFRDYYEGLHRYAYSLLLDNDTAKDIVQQVFIHLWEKKASLNITLSVKAYLYRAVYNRCINYRTREKRFEPAEEAISKELLIQPEFLSEVRELSSLIEQAIASLPTQCREVFRKSREEEKSYPVIAKEMGISVKTVEGQISKALKMLRSAVETYQILFYTILLILRDLFK